MCLCVLFGKTSNGFNVWEDNGLTQIKILFTVINFVLQIQDIVKVNSLSIFHAFIYSPFHSFTEKLKNTVLLMVGCDVGIWMCMFVYVWRDMSIEETINTLFSVINHYLNQQHCEWLFIILAQTTQWIPQKFSVSLYQSHSLEINSDKCCLYYK